jgi:ATP-dependent helicase Lhr and Lhr-like helicase
MESVLPVVDERAIEGLKFSACLPTDMALEMLGKRLTDVPGARRIVSESVKFVAIHHTF